MSNYLAVATVTKALVQMLDTAVKAAVGGAGVVTKRPDVTTADKTVDLFLYQVTPNAALRNSDLPTRNALGQVITRPTCALDLHYLISFYGDGDSYASQRMLGAVVTALLAEPGLTRERILSVSKDDNNDNMSGSDLAAAVEQVKFTQQALTLEELSRIWSIFYQVPYVLSVAYTASVVIIESEEPVLASQPVLQRGPGDRGVETQLGPFPQLDSWHVGEGNDDAARLQFPSYPSARLGTILTLRGRNLGGDSMVVQLMNQHLQLPVPDLPATVTAGRPGEVKIAIPNATADATKWVAGLYSVAIAVTSGGTTRTTNVLALPFAPQIAGTTVGARDVDGNVVVTVTAAPTVRAAQDVFLSLSDRDVAATTRALDTDPLQFTVLKPAAGVASIRLRVDGVDSMQFKGQGTPSRPVLDPKTITFPA